MNGRKYILRHVTYLGILLVHPFPVLMKRWKELKGIETYRNSVLDTLTLCAELLISTAESVAKALAKYINGATASTWRLSLPD